MFYDRCKSAALKFQGQSYKMAEENMGRIKDILTRLMYFSNTNSTVLAPSCTSLLESISRCDKLGDDGLTVIYEYDKVSEIQFEEIRDIITSLIPHIGESASSYNDALTELAFVFRNLIKKFLACITPYCRQQLDYLEVFRKYQTLININALIAETLINECRNVAQEVYEAVAVLSLVSQFLGFAVLGINICVQSVLYENHGVVGENVTSCSQTFGWALSVYHEAIVPVLFPFNSKNFQDFFTIQCDVTKTLNTLLKSVLGLFQGVNITVKEKSQSLLKSADYKCKQ